MKQRYSQLLRCPIVWDGLSQPVAHVKGLKIDPETGKVLAVRVGNQRLIAPVDLIRYRDGQWEVKDPENIIAPEEILRLKKFSAKHTRLINKKVVTTDDENLGRLTDYVLEMNTVSLLQFEVTQRLLGVIPTQKRLLSWRDIVRITEQAVIVRPLEGNVRDQKRTWRWRQGDLPAPNPMTRSELR